MDNRYKNAIITTFIAAALPATVSAHNTANKGLEGLGALFAILVGIMLVGALTLILTIINVFKKNRTLRIVCIVLTAPYIALSLFVAQNGYSMFPAVVTVAMIFLIYKSIPPKTTPPPPPTSETITDNETPD